MLIPIDWRRAASVTVVAVATALAGCDDPSFHGPGYVDLDAVPGANDDNDDGIPDDVGDTTMTETVRGFVHDPLGLPLQAVAVLGSDGSEVVSDDEGHFELPDVPVGTRLVLTFILDGYATNQSEYVVYEDGSNFLSHTLAPVDLVTAFDSDDGIAFNIDGTHDFTIPAGTIVDADGNPVDGVISLQATVWDRTTPLDEGGEFLASPGDGRGTMDNGEDHLLYTLGMFQLELATQTGEVVTPGPGFSLNVQVPPDSNFEDDEEVPYWDYDEDEGTWVQEEEPGKIVPLPGGGQVWEFEPVMGLPIRQSTVMRAGNPDKPIFITVTGTAKGVVTDWSGNPMIGAPVRIISSDLTFQVNTQTNSLGEFSATVPPWVSTPVGPNGRPLMIEVDYEAAQKPSLWRGNPIPPPGAGGAADFGTVVAGSMTCLQGTVVDSAGQPVSGVEIASPHGGNASTDGDGAFCMEVPKWQPSTVYAVAQPGAAEGYEPVRFRPAATAQGGTCDSSCPNVVELRAYDQTSCASGRVLVDGVPSEGLRVDVFEPRFPTAPVFSALTGDGDYCVVVPAETDVRVRVGAGVLAESNECASYAIDAAPVAETCDGDWCAQVPTFDCGG